MYIYPHMRIYLLIYNNVYIELCLYILVYEYMYMSIVIYKGIADKVAKEAAKSTTTQYGYKRIPKVTYTM